ncbi:hypothetical protein, partial [Nocardia tengchongensis]
MTRHSIACILPPDLLVSLARDATPAQRLAVLTALDVDSSFRQARAEAAARLAAPVRLALAAAGGTPHRWIYDQRHSQSPSPGTLIRR